jgi:hypothetical protein
MRNCLAKPKFGSARLGSSCESKASPPTQDDLCRQVVVMCCIGEAQTFIQRLSCETPRPAYFWTFDGLLKALHNRFTHTVEEKQARRALDALRMGPHMCARDYCTQFERLLDEVASMSEADIMYAFAKGLPDSLTMWLNFTEPKSLNEATTLVCKMAGQPQSLPSSSSALPSPSAQPMEIGRLSRPSLAPMSRRPNPKPRAGDPRKAPKWPRWARVNDAQLQHCMSAQKCYLCQRQDHRWQSCPRLRPSSPPFAARPPSSPPWAQKNERGPW